MSPSRRAVPSSLVLLLAVGLAGCTGGGEPSGPEPTTAVSTGASGATTPPEPVAGVIDLTAANFAETIAAALAGKSSWAFDMSIGSAGVTATASGVQRTAADGTAEMAMQFTIPQAGQVEMVLVGGVVYMNMGELTQGMFVTLDPNDPAAGLDGMPIDVDPAGDVRALADAIVSVTPAGEPEEIDGVLVQRFEVLVDPAKATGQVRKSLDDAAAQGAELPGTLTYHYWVDAAGLIHKVTSEVLGVTTEMTFSGWGEPVDVQAPPADQILQM